MGTDSLAFAVGQRSVARTSQRPAAPQRAPGEAVTGANGGTLAGRASPLSLLDMTITELEALRLELADPPPRQETPDSQVATRLRVQLAGLSELLAHVRQFAFHDELTGLPNRALLLDRLQQSIALATRQDKRLGVLMVDLDGFKHVNDAYGHDAGDRLLQHVAWLLRSCIRAGDTACRYGGDEFVVMLPEMDEAESVHTVVMKIRARLAASYFIEGDLIPLTASIGVAVFPDDQTESDALLKHADVMMYREKTRDSAGR